MADKFGYKGKETALNGLTKITQEQGMKYDESLKKVVEFAKENIEGFKDKGHLPHSADRAAKIIQNGHFKEFKQFIEADKNNEKDI